MRVLEQLVLRIFWSKKVPIKNGETYIIAKFINSAHLVMILLFDEHGQ
jgi:hypothetical protein